MIRILFILLLVSNFSFGQIIFDFGFTTPVCNTSNSATFGTVNTTFDADKLYLFVAITTGANQFGTLTATSLTWENVVNYGSYTSRIQIFRCMPTSSVGPTESVTIGSFGTIPDNTVTGLYYNLIEVSNVQTGGNGANAIRQIISDSSTSADPSLTLSALTQRNAVLSFFNNNANVFGGTAESGWTEQTDCGYNDPVTGNYVMYRINGTDSTPTVTASSSTWKGFALELRQSGRRVTLID